MTGAARASHGRRAAPPEGVPPEPPEGVPPEPPQSAEGMAPPAAGEAAARAGYEKEWEEMSPEEQAAVTVLGWTPSSWDDADQGPRGPHWLALSDEQRRAAELLGYDQGDFNQAEAWARARGESLRRGQQLLQPVVR